MKTYVYTQDANGTRQVSMPADDATLELILQGAPIMGYVIGDRTSQESSINMQTGERGGETRLITLTLEPLDMQGYIMALADVMEVSHMLRPGGRVWL